MYSVIVWYNPYKQNYYHRYVKGFGYSYDIGYTNSYGHYVVYKLTLNHNIRPIRYNLKQRIINTLLKELEKGD